MPSFQEFHTTPHPGPHDFSSAYSAGKLSAFSIPTQESTPSQEDNPADNDTKTVPNSREEFDNDVDEDESGLDLNEYDDEGYFVEDEIEEGELSSEDYE